MTNLIGILVGLLLTTAQSNHDAINEQKTDQTVNTQSVQGITYNNDPLCKTEQLQPDHVRQIILETQTMDLNFVALAEAESGLYNWSKKKVSTESDNYYRGIFQVHDRYHKMDDYCSPAEQVRWLERKLNEGARPERLFPSLYHKLYEK